MSDLLDAIISHKRSEVVQRRAQLTADQLERRLAEAPAARDFAAALAGPGPIKLIAEIKRASPSAGLLREDFDPPSIARIYEQHGAAAISVLTDERFFQGRLEHLSAVRRQVGVPVLRKDFLIDPYQLLEARVAGADAVLLIAEVLPNGELPQMLQAARALGMEALVELYDPDQLPRVLETGAKVVGINNRDLRSFEVDLEHTLQWRDQVPDSCILVSESGIRSREDVHRLQEAGVNAILVGETLMRAPDIGACIRELMSDATAE